MLHMLIETKQYYHQVKLSISESEKQEKLVKELNYELNKELQMLKHQQSIEITKVVTEYEEKLQGILDYSDLGQMIQHETSKRRDSNDNLKSIVDENSVKIDRESQLQTLLTLSYEQISANKEKLSYQSNMIQDLGNQLKDLSNDKIALKKVIDENIMTVKFLEEEREFFKDMVYDLKRINEQLTSQLTNQRLNQKVNANTVNRDLSIDLRENTVESNKSVSPGDVTVDTAGSLNEITKSAKKNDKLFYKTEFNRLDSTMISESIEYEISNHNHLLYEKYSKFNSSHSANTVSDFDKPMHNNITDNGKISQLVDSYSDSNDFGDESANTSYLGSIDGSACSSSNSPIRSSNSPMQSFSELQSLENAESKTPNDNGLTLQDSPNSRGNANRLRNRSHRFGYNRFRNSNISQHGSQNSKEIDQVFEKDFENDEQEQSQRILDQFQELDEEIQQNKSVSVVSQSTSNHDTNSNRGDKDVVARLTNPSNFTGVYKKVFEQDVISKRKKVQEIKNSIHVPTSTVNSSSTVQTSYPPFPSNASSNSVINSAINVTPTAHRPQTTPNQDSANGKTLVSTNNGNNVNLRPVSSNQKKRTTVNIPTSVGSSSNDVAIASDEVASGFSYNPSFKKSPLQQAFTKTVHKKSPIRANQLNNINTKLNKDLIADATDDELGQPSVQLRRHPVSPSTVRLDIAKHISQEELFFRDTSPS